MSRHGVGSVVIIDDSGAPVGIVTDRDLRDRLIAAGRPATTAVDTIMSAPLRVVAAGALALEALLEMTRHGIHHLGVVENERLLGMISSHDLLGLQSIHPVGLAAEVERATTLDELTRPVSRMTDIIRALADGGAGAVEIGRVIAELNDRIVRRLLALMETQLAGESGDRPPAAYSWLVAGSEGRREQTLKTDQDNGLVYDDPHPADAAACESYFRRLGAAAAEGLTRLGYPPCPGGFMASNPRWCRPLSAWRADVETWLDAPEPQRLLFASVFFDMRPVAGDERPGLALWRWICERAPASTLFLRFMALTALERGPALDLLGRLAVAGRGPHRGSLDLKASALLPVTQAMRVYALSLGIAETNTVDRLRAAAERGAIPAAESRDLGEAYAVVSRLRLRHQLDQLAAGQAPDNWIDPDALPRTDRLLLKEAFKTIAWLQRLLEDRFQTNLVS
jgi:CBS domain-containing protein